MPIALHVGVRPEGALRAAGDLIRLAGIVPPRIVRAGAGIAVVAGSPILLAGVVVEARRRSPPVGPARRPARGRSADWTVGDSSAADVLEIVVVAQVRAAGVVHVALEGAELRGVAVLVAVGLAVHGGVVSRHGRAVRVGVLVPAAVAGRGPVLGRAGAVALFGAEGVEVRHVEGGR